ncbi:glyceraldehyde-3-phosphate dehydrogenase [Jannaschia sp. KMU-145]
MTNRPAFVIGLALLACALADILLNDAGVIVFLGRQLIRLSDYISFWR